VEREVVNMVAVAKICTSLDEGLYMKLARRKVPGLIVRIPLPSGSTATVSIFINCSALIRGAKSIEDLEYAASAAAEYASKVLAAAAREDVLVRLCNVVTRYRYKLEQPLGKFRFTYRSNSGAIARVFADGEKAVVVVAGARSIEEADSLFSESVEAINNTINGNTFGQKDPLRLGVAASH